MIFLNKISLIVHETIFDFVQYYLNYFQILAKAEETNWLHGKHPRVNIF